MIYADDMELRIKRHEAWRLEYQQEPYLRDLSSSDLFARAGHVMTGLVQHSQDGKIAVILIDEDISKMEKFTHVLEELVIRGIDYRQPKIMEAMQAPQPNSAKVSRALQILARTSWPDPFLVKFGERKNMASLFLEGKGRISLAKTYDDALLGPARANDESEISVYVHPTDAYRLMGVEHDANGAHGVKVDGPYLGSV
jgi:hypothetical protein